MVTLQKSKKISIFFASCLILLLLYMYFPATEKTQVLIFDDNDNDFCNNIYSNNKSLYSTSPDVSEIDREFNYNYKKFFKCYNLDSSKFFDMPMVSLVRYERTIFQSVAEHVYSNFNIKNLTVENVKCGDAIFLTSENIKIFKEEFLPKIKNSFFLITHESDFSVGEPWHLEMLEDSRIIMWFTQNIIAVHPKLKAIPIGVIPPHGENFKTLYNQAKNVVPFAKKSTLLYLNFRPITNNNRTAVYEYFKNSFKNNSMVKIDEKIKNWHSYLMEVGNSQFVLSPPGTGLDCHRTWESLALGSIPIVLNNSIVPLYDGLPVMIVNEWKDVTEEAMQKFKESIVASNFSKDGVAWKPKFWLRYWITVIMNVKREYFNNFCVAK